MLLTLLLASCFAVHGLHAQSGIGYVDETAILEAMPEAKYYREKMQEYKQQLVASLQSRHTELYAAQARYDSLALAGSAPAVLLPLEKEIREREQMLARLVEAAAANYEEKGRTYAAYMHEKVREAVKAVVQEQGLDAVINISRSPFDPYRPSWRDAAPYLEQRAFNRSFGPDFEEMIMPHFSQLEYPAIYPGKGAVNVQALVLKKMGLPSN